MTTEQATTRARISHAYLTDEVNLYRLVGWVSRSVSAAFAELEDCRSLEIVLVSAEHLARSRPRLVAAGVAA